MLTLNDGRSELWQWDTNRKLTVDAECSQVHFSNKVFGRSVDVDVVDGIAVIPDILLQTDKELTAWAFVGTPENGYTKISKTFNVNRRNKPADYVFTPQDQSTLGDILDRIEDLENRPSGDVSKEDIQNAVNDYLDKNPVSVVEKDPTVPAWAKQPEKPKYTAAEVGALPNTTAIPVVPSALPNPHKLTINGAVQAEYDGSKEVTLTIPESSSVTGDYIPTPTTAEIGQTIVVKTVDETGKPTEWEAGNVNLGLTFMGIIEITESSAGLSLTQINGESFCLKRMVIAAKTVTSSTTSNSSNTWLNLAANSKPFTGVQYAVAQNGTKYSLWDIVSFPVNDANCLVAASCRYGAREGLIDGDDRTTWMSVSGKGITEIRFKMGDNYTTFEPGTLFYIFGEK